ncbi:MAG: UDP-3-O-acyl-N-acetylglucosamine deacetylase [Phycisphaerales bacterium]|nr:UDP-3-O-acyl-N-acetylglucosamine deacetylase [Phycisphaerales bacterium]
MTPRRTVAGPAHVAGVGLFSARPVTLEFRPAPAGTGLVFRRMDLPGRPEVPALAAFAAASPTGRNTVLARGPAAAATTEHVLSALTGLGVTDAIIELSAEETPICDGSAGPFVQAILGAGVTDIPGIVRPLVVEREVVVEGGGGRIVARPAACPRYTYELDYGPASPITAQSASWPAGNDYAGDIAPARTFCLEREALAMRAAGLFGHLSPRDMLVIGPAGPIDNALRFADEPARHKLLDLIGDLALAGRPVQGEVIAARSGHALNLALVRALLA